MYYGRRYYRPYGRKTRRSSSKKTSKPLSNIERLEKSIVSVSAPVEQLKLQIQEMGGKEKILDESKRLEIFWLY